MSTDPSILLRLLEPAVRPDRQEGSSRPATGGVPFEQTPFEQLLHSARGQAGSARGVGESDRVDIGVEKQAVDPLASLGDVDRIENAALREALAAARGQSVQTNESDM